MVSTLVAAGSVSRKSISFALSAGCSVREAIDQYIEALFTIFGDYPLAWAGIRSSFSSFPLAAAKAELSAFSGHVPLEAAQQLFEAARVIDSQAQLRSALSDPSVEAASKRALVARVFAPFDVAAKRLLTVIAGHAYFGQFASTGPTFRAASAGKDGSPHASHGSCDAPPMHAE